MWTMKFKVPPNSYQMLINYLSITAKVSFQQGMHHTIYRVELNRLTSGYTI